MKKFLIILLALSIFGYVAYTYYKANIAIAATTAEKEAAYMVTKATLKNTLNLSGKIDASEKATLGFQTAGRLAWVGVKEGDYVKKGQGIRMRHTRMVMLVTSSKDLSINLSLVSTTQS